MAIHSDDEFLAFLAPPSPPASGDRPIFSSDLTSSESTVRRNRIKRRATHSDGSAAVLPTGLRSESGNWTYSPLVGLIHERDDKIFAIRSLILSGTLGEKDDKLVEESVLGKLSGCIQHAVAKGRGSEAVEVVVLASRGRDALSISPRLAAFCLACCMKLGDAQTRSAALQGALALEGNDEFRARYTSFMRIIGKGGATGDKATDSVASSASDSVGGIQTILHHRMQRRLSRRSMDRSRLADTIKC